MIFKAELGASVDAASDATPLAIASPKAVVVLRFSSAGDVILTAPAVEALTRAWPTARIVFVTKAAFAGLLRGNPHIHDIVALQREESVWSLRERLVARLAACKGEPAALLDLHGKVRSALLKSTLPVRRAATWPKRPWQQSLAVRLGWRTFRAQATIAARYHRTVEQLVGQALAPVPLRYYVHDDDRRAAWDALQQAGVVLRSPLVAMSPGALWETKRWPVERFGHLARRLVQAGYQVLVSGSPAERDLTAQVAQADPGIIDIGGVLSLPQLGALLERCAAFVANDSGPMHMARGLGVPTLAFFGSTDPGQFDLSGHGVMFAGVKCSPCSFHGRKRCPRQHFRCMLDLHVDAAWNVLQQLLP